MTRLLIGCGPLSSLLYAAMLAFVPFAWAGYSSASQTVSELSAIDATSRPLWTALALLWTVLYLAFGWGVSRCAAGNRQLRLVGVAIIVAASFGVFWPPMHQREVLAAGGKTLTDALHVAWTIINGLLTLTAMVAGAFAFGRRFRWFTWLTMAVLLLAGTLTSFDAADLEANRPTPWIGVWERINIGVWLLWVAALATGLLQRSATSANIARSDAARA